MTTQPKSSLEDTVREAVSENAVYEFTFVGPDQETGTATLRPYVKFKKNIPRQERQKLVKGRESRSHIFQGVHRSDFKAAALALGLTIDGDSPYSMLYRGRLAPLPKPPPTANTT